jgi:hypothetical protein
VQKYTKIEEDMTDVEISFIICRKWKFRDGIFEVSFTDVFGKIIADVSEHKAVIF